MIEEQQENFENVTLPAELEQVAASQTIAPHPIAHFIKMTGSVEINEHDVYTPRLLRKVTPDGDFIPSPGDIILTNLR